MKLKRAKSKASTKTTIKHFSPKKVEDGILSFLIGGVANTDIEFGETNVSFEEKELFNRGLNFKKFDFNGIHFNLANKDEKQMTITYLFH